MTITNSEFEDLQAELNAWRDRARQLEMTLRKIETALGQGRSLEDLQQAAQLGGVEGDYAVLALLARKALAGLDGGI